MVGNWGRTCGFIGGHSNGHGGKLVRKFRAEVGRGYTRSTHTLESGCDLEERRFRPGPAEKHNAEWKRDLSPHSGWIECQRFGGTPGRPIINDFRKARLHGNGR